MTRAVGTKFKLDGHVYTVKRTPIENIFALRHCSPKCAFYNNQGYCRKIIKVTGDCQPRYRTDYQPAHFVKIS